MGRGGGGGGGRGRGGAEFMILLTYCLLSNLFHNNNIILHISKQYF